MTVGAPAKWVGGTSWPRGYLRPCLLLLIAEESAHGYDLLDRLEALGTPAIDAGTLYRALRAMERDRLVESRWVDVLTESQRSVAAYLRRCAALEARERAKSEARLNR
jgi:DNA-binding PadR family transcriptional regulator